MRLTLTLLATLLLISPSSHAHHSFAANFNLSKTIEIEGVIQSVIWKNPHVRLKVLVNGGTPEEQVWDVESHSLSNLHRQAIDSSVLVIGDAVKMAGPPGRRKKNFLFMYHLLLDDGREVVFQQGAEPIYSQKVVGTSDILRGAVGDTNPEERPTSIFAVWTTDYSNPASWPVFPKSSENHPLTDAARAKMAEFDIDRDNPLANCAPKGMPSAMAQPYPIQLINSEDEIVLKIEEYDATRNITLSNSHDVSGIETSNLGYSTGRWDGDTLVVTTTKISFPYFNVLAAPKAISQSKDMHVVETFKLRGGGAYLDYTMTVTDPATFTRPITFNKFWQWRPGAKIEPFDCDDG